MGSLPNEPADPNTIWVKFENGRFEYGAIVGMGALLKGTYTVRGSTITLMFEREQTYNGEIINDNKIELSLAGYIQEPLLGGNALRRIIF